MTSINLLKVAAMPGSGSGCQSALPAEKPRGRAQPHRERAHVHIINVVPKISPEQRDELIKAFRTARTADFLAQYRKPCKATVFTQGGFVGTNDDWKKHFPGEAVIPALRRPADLLDAAGGGE